MILRLELKLPAGGRDLSVGHLAWDDAAAGRMAFQYGGEWLRHGFSIGADLPLQPAVQFPQNPGWPGTRGRFGFVDDHAPGDWIALLLEKAHLFGIKSIADGPECGPARLWAFSGQRNTRFSALNLPLNEGVTENVPVRISDRRNFRRLVSALEVLRLSPGRLTRADTEMLLSNVACFGGTRLKAIVTDGGGAADAWLLRFLPGREAFNEALWTELGGRLARRCGIPVCESRLAGTDIFLERRFDRDPDGSPRFCLSASSLVRRGPKAPGYLDLADILCREGSRPAGDLSDLFNRLLFNTLTCNRRGRLRDFWFYREDGGWRLAPMHAPCPEAPAIRSRLLPIPIVRNDTEARPDTVLSVARYFGVSVEDAERRKLEFMRAVSAWKKEASALAIHPAEIAAMEGAFFS